MVTNVPRLDWRLALPTALAAGLILFLRRPEAFIDASFWAEDGAVFFLQNEVHGPAEALTLPYSGYHHLLLRLLAAALGTLPIVYLPQAYAAVSTLAVMLLAVALFSPRLPFPPRWRPAFALGLVLVPHSGEVMHNLANLQWLGAIGLLLLAAARDADSRPALAGDLVAALLLGLTGAFSVLFSPLFILRAALARSRAAVLLASVVGVAALVQGVTAWSVVADVRPAETAPVWGLVTWRLWGGLLMPPPLMERLPLAFFAVAGALATGWLGWASAWRTVTATRWLRLVLTAGLVLLLLGLLLRLRGYLGALMSPMAGDRYFYGPRLLLCWLVLLVAADAGARAWIARVTALTALVVTSWNFRYERYPVRDWPVWAKRLDDPRQEVRVPTNPPGTSFLRPPRR